MPLVIVACAVAVLIFLIVKLKLNTFVALIITSFIAALALGIPADTIPSVIESGIGGQLGHLAVIFGFGSMLGKLVADCGGGHRIATTLIRRFGRTRIQIAVVLASFIVGLALFFEVGLVVLLPIIFVIARELDMPLMYLGIPMAATLNVTHAFLPPHPAPTAITETLGASMGQVLLYGVIVSIPTVIVCGPLFNRVLHRLKPELYRSDVDVSVLGEVKEFRDEDTPGFAVSVVTSMMPVLLIAVATIFGFILPEDNVVNEVIQFVGAPDVAMLLSLLLAIFTMGIRRKLTMTQIGSSMVEAVKQVAMMLLIIGGGGAFKQVLTAGGISDYISTLFTNINMPPLLAAWLGHGFRTYRGRFGSALGGCHRRQPRADGAGRGCRIRIRRSCERRGLLDDQRVLRSEPQGDADVVDHAHLSALADRLGFRARAVAGGVSGGCTSRAMNK